MGCGNRSADRRAASAIDVRADRLEAEGSRPRHSPALFASPMPGPLFQPQSSMPRQPAPDLSLPLAQPISLTRGPGTHLVTLMDAALLIRDLEPWRQARPVWDRAAEMILIAAETREQADLAEATRQMLVALEKENW